MLFRRLLRWLALPLSIGGALGLGCSDDSSREAAGAAGGTTGSGAAAGAGGHGVGGVGGGTIDPTALGPALHLRKAPVEPPLVQMLQDPAEAAAWYGSSPTWFGHGGLDGTRNHTEVLATFDDAALYVALLTIDRDTVLPSDAEPDLTRVDSAGVWIGTPDGQSFAFLVGVDGNQALHAASGDVGSFDPHSDALGGWSQGGWQSGGKSVQVQLRIPWTTLGMACPTPGTRVRANFVSYNQTSAGAVQPAVRSAWVDTSETSPEQWGELSFDELPIAGPSDVSAEARLTLRPQTGFGADVTLSPGDNAATPNVQPDALLTESDWNDWDATQYMLKAFYQFDLSMIPADRTIIEARLLSHCRGPYNDPNSEQVLHVVRLGAPYDPGSATFLTSPAALENGYRATVTPADFGEWIEFDVTLPVAKAFAAGQTESAFALAPSSGDIHNGKIWDPSFGRADWYDPERPQLRVTFGKRGTSFDAPIEIGSLACTSVATAASKNKLTNGTFAYGSFEGVADTTYWCEPPWSVQPGTNTPVLHLGTATNPTTGHSALRFDALDGWKSLRQLATGIEAGHTYALSAWLQGSDAQAYGDLRLVWLAQDGTELGTGGGSVSYQAADWQQVSTTVTAPAGAAFASVDVFVGDAAAGRSLLVSDVQLEEGSSPSAYEETMGFYYPDRPRAQ